jgi:hypothetical protein
MYGGVVTKCKVVRKIVDEKTGEAEMYVTLDGYAYRFYIEVAYTGADPTKGEVNTYEIVKMTLDREIPSYNFLYSYYLYAMFYGQIIENDIGTIYIHGNYDEAGEETDFYVTAEFLEGSEFKGVDDKIISFEKGTYELNGSLYSTRFTATDGEKYGLHFQLQSVMGSTGFISILTRYQTVTVGDYTFEVSHIVATEASNYKVGDLYLYDTVLSKNGEVLDASHIYELNKVYYYVVPGEGNATYYKIRLEEKNSLEEGYIPEYTADDVTIETEEATTHVLKDYENLSVDISGSLADGTAKVMIIKMSNETFYAKESTYTYDADSKTYKFTVETTNGTTCTVTIFEDGTAEVTF